MWFVVCVLLMLIDCVVLVFYCWLLYCSLIIDYDCCVGFVCCCVLFLCGECVELLCVMTCCMYYGVVVG